ncbi:MAG TPA: elongation factor P maturation arginine rhamnosyltransferase EarP, partial [Methylophilaceae bacterium]|nr:elongation factor P maturation arginine rhamnosyltransferase EarP [Methylophilaceae bacterium]
MPSNQALKTEPSSAHPVSHWDIFCRIVDNYGDIGVCWRLARQLTAEYGLSLRLWVDDLAVAKRLIPELDSGLETQFIDGVEICRWLDDFPEAEVADVVIEAFACDIPQRYLAAMV